MAKSGAGRSSLVYFEKIDQILYRDKATESFLQNLQIIISIVVENAYQTKHHIATTIEITTTTEIIISIVIENKFQT